MTAKKKYLTKSRFKLATECATKLFYTGKSEYANQNLDDSFLLALADGGFQVGELAKCYFSGGHDIKTLDYGKALAETNKLLQLNEVTIYEAAIATETLFIRADILVKKGNRISLYEVKAKSFDPNQEDLFANKNGTIKSSWKPYLYDVAFQKYVINQAFPQFEVSAHLMMADRSSTCPTDGLNQKFLLTKDDNGRKSVSVSESLIDADLKPPILCTVNVDAECGQIYAGTDGGSDQSLGFIERIDLFADHYGSDIKVTSPISTNCSSCEFYTLDQDEQSGMKSGKKECWKENLGWNDKDFESLTVLNVWNLRKKDKLIEASCIKMSDLTEEDISPKPDNKPGISASERQWLQIEKYQNNDNSVWLDRDNLQYQMDSWTFPLHFIDFETAMAAIPFNAGRRPYEGIAFQFSHHIVHEDGTVEHCGEYLNTQRGAFPNYDFVRALKAQLENDNGSIFRYSNHENTFLNMIYRQLQADDTVEDRMELCSFIKSITKSVGDSIDQWIGERNMVDLWELVKRFYYDPHTNGSNSIKQVLPAILNSSAFLQKKYSKPIYGASGGIKSLNFKDWQWIKFKDKKVIDPYKTLPKMFQNISDKDMRILSNDDELRDGGAALTAYASMQFEEMSDYERNEIRKALLKYCELDTMAMVIIYEGWKDLLSLKDEKGTDKGYINFATQLNKEYRKDCGLSESKDPWFAHFSLLSNEKKLSYKIGNVRNERLRIIDWRHPLSKGFYEMEPGDSFDLDEYQKSKQTINRYASVAGEILQHTRIVNKNRKIIQANIKTEDGSFVIEAKGDAFVLLDEVATRFNSIEGLPDIRSLLSKDQYDLITTSNSKPLIIQGQAGSGKTTVALYRASWLTYAEADNPVDPQNILIVMFNKALQGFVSGTLEPIGLGTSNVFTFHAWAFKEVKRAYNGHIEVCVESFDGEDVAKKIKKQIGLLNALDEFVSIQTSRLFNWVEQMLQPYNAQDWIDTLHQSNLPIVQRLIGLRKEALVQRNNATGREKERLEQIHILVNKAITRMTLYKEELLNFFKNKELLKKHLPHLSYDELEILSQYQKALQGKERTPRRPGPYISFEDLALILRLIQLKHGGLHDKSQDDYVNLYDHLVIDEAQDFGALEMTVLLSAVRSRSGVTIVGDTNQKIIPEADFMGWDSLAKQLGIEGATVSRLEVAHRSTKPIMDIACSILNEPESVGRPGSQPSLNIVDDEEEKISCIVSTLKTLLFEEANLHICIVCRHVKDVKPLIERLNVEEIGMLVRLGHNREFDFTSGITVTNLRQIKGLEFDSVILLDPSEENYPNDIQGKKYLYTVITRAKSHLCLIGDCEPTSLLQMAIEDSLIDVKNQLEVAPIEFTDDDDEPF